MGFAFFDHTGDIGVEVQSPSLPALFAEAAQALTCTLTDADDLRPVNVLRVFLRGPSLDLLLVDWLSELLFRFEVDGFLMSAVEVRLMEEVREDAGWWAFDARVSGEPGAARRVPIKVLIKAVTYHALAVERQDDGWRARVVFDV